MKTFEVKKMQNLEPLLNVSIAGTRVIPSDTFVVGKDKFILMDIIKNNVSGFVFLEIMGLEGKRSAQTAKINKTDFEGVGMDGFLELFDQNIISSDSILDGSGGHIN